MTSKGMYMRMYVCKQVHALCSTHCNIESNKHVWWIKWIHWEIVVGGVVWKIKINKNSLLILCVPIVCTVHTYYV